MIVGICPNCLEVVSSRKKDLYLNCAKCGDTIPLRQAVSYLTELCTDPSNVNDVLDLCLKLEETEAVEVPLAILKKLTESHPYNEQVAYSYVRMSGYEPQAVRNYLNIFANVKGEKPYAIEFLENAINTNNMIFHSLLSNYIDNKIPNAKKPEYRERLVHMKEAYIGGHGFIGEGDGMALMYTIYGVAALFNAGLVVLFFLVHLHIVFNILIAMAAFSLELFLLYMHNQTYGNRLGIKKYELVFMVAFLSSFCVTVAGMIIAAIV
ncbi:MAG: hypothetical protein LBG88_04105 [Christensenellaceae bacterium]|jgi:hypothetical protein|nr:hypothetical protein [Christensenellaceae bacterium]